MNLVQDFVNTMLASLFPVWRMVADGWKWRIDFRKNAGWVNDTVMFWKQKHGHALIGCYDFEFDDWTQQPWTEGAEKLKSSDVTHWRPFRPLLVWRITKPKKAMTLLPVRSVNLKRFISFSGGVESTTMCVLFGKGTTAIWCDTGAEHDLMYQRINEVERNWKLYMGEILNW